MWTGIQLRAFGSSGWDLTACILLAIQLLYLSEPRGDMRDATLVLRPMILFGVGLQPPRRWSIYVYLVYD